MKMKKYFIIALICILLDQIMKSIALRYFSFSKNYGAAFGIFSGQVKLIILLTFFALGFLIYYSKDIKKYGQYGLGLLFGGLVGNLIDRMAYGYVIDYIRIWIWPAFNLADVFNIAGVIILILYLRKNL